MSLMKKRILTEKQKAAARANGGKSKGAATSAGRARIRDANLRHRVYSQSEEVILSGLGETREEFERLRQGIREEFPLASHSHPQWAEDLTLAMWRLQRFERRQEEVEIQQALEIHNNEKWSISPATVLDSMSAEQCAQREVIRITELLLEAEKRLLGGLPQKLLKTQETR